MYAGGVDMRKGFDSLSGMVQQEFKQSPTSGDVFIFINLPRNRIKMLQWQGDGFAIFFKRLEKGTYELPQKNNETNTVLLSHQQLQFILDGIMLKSIKKRPRYEHQIVNKM
jgi:transposase